MLARRTVDHRLVYGQCDRDVRRQSRLRRRQVPGAVRRGGGRPKLERLRLLLHEAQAPQAGPHLVLRHVRRERVEQAGDGDARAERRGARRVARALPSGAEQHGARAARWPHCPGGERDPLRRGLGPDEAARPFGRGQHTACPAAATPALRGRFAALHLRHRRRVSPEEQRTGRSHVDVSVRWRRHALPDGDARLARERMDEGARHRQRVGDIGLRNAGDADLRGRGRYRGHHHREEGRRKRRRHRGRRSRDAGEDHAVEGAVRAARPE